MQVRCRPLNVSFRRGSRAEQNLWLAHECTTDGSSCRGARPHSRAIFIFTAAKIITDLHFMNFFVGADAWAASDISNLNENLAAARSDTGLNNVMEQYFPGSITSTFDGSGSLAGPAPVTFSQGDVEALVASLEAQGRFAGRDLQSTVFNFMLPTGTILNADEATTSSVSRAALTSKDTDKKKSPIPDDDDGDSTQRLGGYHGSVHIGGDTLYYAIGVFSEVRPDGNPERYPGIRYAVEECRGDLLPRIE